LFANNDIRGCRIFPDFTPWKNIRGIFTPWKKYFHGVENGWDRRLAGLFGPAQDQHPVIAGDFCFVGVARMQGGGHLPAFGGIGVQGFFEFRGGDAACEAFIGWGQDLYSLTFAGGWAWGGSAWQF
jgi:hypothetical protein